MLRGNSGVRSFQLAMGCLTCCAWFTAAEVLRADGPTLKRLLPAGAGLSQTVEVAALGDAPKWPVQVWTDDVHMVWEPLTEKGKFRVIVDAEARLGVHHVRFSDEDNCTDAQRFLIGPIAEKSEAEPNDEAGEAFKVDSLPILINGVLEKRGLSIRLQLNLSKTSRW